MKKNIYESPVMMLRSFGMEDIVCESSAGPHFVKGNNAATAGSKMYNDVKTAWGE